MRIMLFLPGLGNGGAERVILRLLNYLSNQGHDVRLVVASRKGRLVNNVSIDVTYLDAKYSLLSLFKYISFVKNFKPDIVLATLSSAIIISGLASLISFKRNYVLVARVANIVSLKKMNSFRLLFELLALNISNGIICNSQATRESVKKLLILKNDHLSLKVISNPVLDDDYQTFLSKRNEQKKLLKKIVFIGRFVPQKQVLHAVQAFNIIASRVKDVELTIIGEGPQYQEIQRLIEKYNLQDKVIIRSYCDDIPSLLMNSDFLINTSEFEGFGNIFIEGLAFCDYLVCYNSPGGANEILKNTEARLVNQGDYQSLANEVISLIKVNKPPKKDFDFLFSYTQKEICSIYEDFILGLKNNEK